MGSRIRQAILLLAVITMVSGLAIAKDGLRLRARLRADASAGDISGNARYRARDNGRMRFQLEVEGFRPGTTLDVVVDGVKVGRVTIDNLGFGELDFDTNIEAGDTEGEPFPGNFPDPRPGSKVRVGQLSGTMQRQN
jgi:hypothetical protein